MATDLLRRFTEVARSNPGVPAVMGPDLCLSFSDLDLLSDRAAAIFTRAGDAGILQGEMPYSIDTLPVIGFYHCRSARHGRPPKQSFPICPWAATGRTTV